ncbi:hypothetical protein [Haloglycomyces albus]|uniref:hypothetical protein n=1 Tax=Haloglycomyces albus TaxID=526067 RepID=UPI00046D1037|nr:hypothetical protein [Haloglycomyces albus]
MPELLGTVTWEDSRVDITQRFGRDTAWIVIDGDLAAIVHLKGHFIRPHNGWTIPDDIQAWLLREAIAAHILQTFLRTGEEADQ